MDLQLRTWVGKTVHGAKTHRLSGKQKFQAQHSVKKMLLAVFSDMSEAIIIHFLEKGATTNSAS